MKQDLLKRYLPIAAAILTMAYFGYHMRPRSDRADDFQFRAFGYIPVIDGGRPKPLDTVARTNLMVITHRQALYDPDTKKTYPATKWLLDCMTTPLPKDEIFNQLFPAGADAGVSYQYKIFRIENDEVLRLLDLKARDGLRYSIVEIASKYPDLANEALRILGDEERGIPAKEAKNYTLFDAKVAELWQHLNLFMKLSAHGAPLTVPNADGGDQWRPFRDAHMELGQLVDQQLPLPETPDAQAYLAYRTALLAYQNGDKATFNKTVNDYLAEMRGKDPARMRAVGVEVFFNEFSPFYHCLVLYAIIAVVGGLAWLAPEWTQSVHRACYAAMSVAFLVHLSGLIVRMYLQDRLFVFVTNLYSSAVFIGLGSVLFCLIAEAFYKNGIAIVVGSVGGFLTLIIAHMLSLSGDTLEMMQAVLDTNFWLATHVTCITLGYVAAFVAGLMGIAYIFLGIFTNMLRKDGSANLTRMTYGVLCAGMFLSFVGTVLGGLWADYSWGRFWGWDPKENGALLIVLWIALILHARWGGMVKHRGIAVLSVLGIIITSWSWFGTNFLGVGLHSYGFRQGAMMSLILIDMVFLGIAGLGLLPLNVWTSFRPPVDPNASASIPRSPARPRTASV